MPVSLFGRTAELQRLGEALVGVAVGVARCGFIEGEPGIGKSVLLEHVTVRARELGFRVFAGRAEELEQDRPCHAMTEALDCVRAGLDERRNEIVRLLRSGSEDGATYRLLDAIEDLIESEALAGPVLLTIDDLQWADANTVRVLGSIARRLRALPLAIVATLRRRPRSEELSALLRTSSAETLRIGLPPLDENSTIEMVRARLGAPPGPRLRAHIDGAAGNPFYITELLDALGAESAVQFDSRGAEIEGSTLPPSLVVTLMHRLSPLSEGVLEVVRNAAVLGASFKIVDLATAAAVSPADALAAVNSLRAEEVLTDDGDKLRFRHDLIREAVYEDLGEPVRLSMHRRIGHALATAGADPLDVAAHLVRGAQQGDTDAANWMIEAADDPGLDKGSEVALIERALEICPDHLERNPLVLRMAGDLMGQGRPVDALAHLHRLLPQLVETEERLGAFQWLMVGCWVAGRGPEMRSWARQIEELVAQLGDHRRPELFILLSWAAELQGNLESALALAERAVALDPESTYYPEAIDRCAAVASTLGRSQEALAYAKRAVFLCPRVFAMWVHQGWALGDLDRIGDAESSLAVGRAIAEDKGLPLIAASIDMESAHLRYSLGRFDDALVDAETAAGISDEFDFAYAGPDEGCIRSWIAYHRHDDAELERVRVVYPSRERGNPPLRPTLDALIALDRGDLESAGNRARELVTRIASATTERRDFDVLPTLARIAFATGDVASADVARDTAAKLEAQSDAPGILLAAARCAAIVDRDVSAAERTVELARLSPRKVLAAGAFEDAASVLDRDSAIGLLTEASALYDQMGAHRDRTRALTALRELGVRTAATPSRVTAVSGWEALTPAELKVVRLAAQGLTNREIGARLFVSHRTVATHLSHVFDKLELRSRVELAREAANRLGDSIG